MRTSHSILLSTLSLAVLFCQFASTPSASALEQFRKLEKCKGFTVLVEDVSSATETFGFSRKWIEDCIELKLRSARLPVLGPEQIAVDSPILYIQVTGLDFRDNFVSNILITFQEPCVSLRTKKTLDCVEVYRVSTLSVLGKDRIGQFRQILAGEIDEFILDFLRANPPSKAQ